MKKLNILIVAIISCFLLACDSNEEEIRDDFLKKANLFYKTAISGNCEKLEDMIEYPILMDGVANRNYDDIEKRCMALSLSADFMAKRFNTSKDSLTFNSYKYVWLKKNILKKHPLLKTHFQEKSDVSAFLLEVQLDNSDVSNNGVISIIFIRDYNEPYGDWRIIMFEPYSLTDTIEGHK